MLASTTEFYTKIKFPTTRCSAITKIHKNSVRMYFNSQFLTQTSAKIRVVSSKSRRSEASTRAEPSFPTDSLPMRSISFSTSFLRRSYDLITPFNYRSRRNRAPSKKQSFYRTEQSPSPNAKYEKPIAFLSYSGACFYDA